MTNKNNSIIAHAAQKILFNNLDEELREHHGKEFQAHLIGEYFESSREEARRHHMRHVAELELKENSLDPFKIVSWHTWYLAQKVHSPGNHEFTDCVINAGLKTLNYFLSFEEPNSSKLGNNVLDLISSMIKNELDEIPDHGIAKNGLYMSFHCAREMEKICKN